jgi:glycine dehydrogenase
MIEPTESEDIHELDRFIEAMKIIAGEIAAITEGKVALEKSALRNAPHTAEDLLRTEWDRGYSREIGAFPAGSNIGLMRSGKYFPTVSRIDGAYGDRNLVCACEPISALAIN